MRCLEATLLGGKATAVRLLVEAPHPQYLLDVSDTWGSYIPGLPNRQLSHGQKHHRHVHIEGLEVEACKHQ